MPTPVGNAVNVRRTVESSGGGVATPLEGRVSAKRCGERPGARPFIDLGEGVGKIGGALAARRDPDFIIIARTDAASGLGLDEAIRRAQAFRKAGADVLFIELKSSPSILDDLRHVTDSVDAPCLVNVDAGGRLGELTAAEIERLGLRIAIYPGLARGAAGFAIRDALAALKRDGNTGATRERMLTLKEYNDALKYRKSSGSENIYMLILNNNLTMDVMPCQPVYCVPCS